MSQLWLIFFELQKKKIVRVEIDILCVNIPIQFCHNLKFSFSKYVHIDRYTR